MMVCMGKLNRSELSLLLELDWFITVGKHLPQKKIISREATGTPA